MGFMYTSLFSLAAIGMFVSVLSHAEQVPRAFTLAESIDYALVHQQTLQNAQFDAQIARRQVQEYYSLGLPIIQAQADFTDYLKLPTSLLPAEFFGGDPGTYIPVQFGTQFNASVGVTVNQLLFDGRYFLGLKAVQTLFELSTKQTQRLQIDVIEQVSKAYLTALVAEKRSEQVAANLLRFQRTLADAEAMYAAGFIEKLDVDQLRVAFNQMRAEYERTKTFAQIALELLKFQMGLDQEQPIVLTDSLRMTDFGLMLQQAAKPDLNNRIEYRMLQDNRLLNEMSIRRYRVGYLPSLYATAGYGLQSQQTRISDIPEGQWFAVGYVGLRLQLPVFDGLQKARQIQIAKLELEKTQNNLSQFRNAMLLQIESAKASLGDAIRALHVEQENLALANEIVRTVQKKFEAGLASALQVTEAETILRNAQVNYLAALQNAWVAKVELDKALGILDKQIIN